MRWRLFPWFLLALPALALAVAAARPSARLATAPSGQIVEDARHRKITLPSPFPGSLLLFPPLTAEYVMAAGGPGSVLATTTINQANLERGLLGQAFPQIGRLTANHAFPTPHAVNLEAAMALHPGAIFIMGWLAPPLDAIGLPTMAVMSPRQEAMIAANAALFARTAGDGERGRELGRRFRQSLEEVARELGPLADAGRPRILEMTIAADGGIRVQGPRGLAARLMTRAGGVNALTSGLAAPRLSPEHVLALDPDVILISPLSTPPTTEAFFREAPWRIFRAARQGRVYRQPEGMASGMSGVVETPLYVRWLAELLHPDRMEPALRARMRQAYLDAFAFPVDEDQLDLALALTANRGSAHYQRFARASAEKEARP